MLIETFFSQPNPNGQCVKATLDGTGNAIWVMTDCSDTSGRGFVCQISQISNEVGKIKF
jgi:hypothetical protein